MFGKKALMIMVLIPVVLLTAGGCSRYKPAPIDISAGEYYEDEEYQKLSGKDRKEYCLNLAEELESLESRSVDAQARVEQNREDITRLTQELRANRTQRTRFRRHDVAAIFQQAQRQRP